MPYSPFFNKQSGTWRVHYDKPGGKVGTKTLGKSKAEAFRKWKSMQITDNPFVQDVAVEYLEGLEKRVKLNTVSQKYLEAAHYAFKNFLSSKLKWNQFTPEKVSEICLKQDWSNDTIALYMGHLKTLSSYGAKRKGLPNVLEDLKKPITRSRDRAATASDLEAICDVIFKAKTPKYHRVAHILAVLYHTGARPGELMDAKREQRDGDKIVLEEWKNAKKSGKPRVIYLSASAQIACDMSEGSDTHLFADSAGNPWNSNSLGVRLRRLTKDAGLPKGLVAYSFRHGYATRALEAGVNVAHLAALMGTSIRMIDKHYGHLAQKEELLRNLARRF